MRPARGTLEEHLLNHGARTENIQPRDKQLRVCRHALDDRVSQFQPLNIHASGARILVGLQQRDQIAYDQRRVHGVRVAGDGKNFRIVSRAICLSGAIAELRPEVASRQLEASFVDFEAVRLGERR